MRFAIVPFLLTVLFTVFPAILAHHPKPSSSPKHPGWYCSDTDLQSRSKIEEFSDKPPHKGSLFGCSYPDGKGGNYVCTFDSKTGECTGGGQHCPQFAHYHSAWAFKRAPHPVPAPTPTATPTPAKYRAARYMLQKKALKV